MRHLVTRTASRYQDLRHRVNALSSIQRTTDAPRRDPKAYRWLEIFRARSRGWGRSSSARCGSRRTQWRRLPIWQTLQRCTAARVSSFKWPPSSVWVRPACTTFSIQVKTALREPSGSVDPARRDVENGVWLAKRLHVVVRVAQRCPGLPSLAVIIRLMAVFQPGGRTQRGWHARSSKFGCAERVPPPRIGFNQRAGIPIVSCAIQVELEDRHLPAISGRASAWENRQSCPADRCFAYLAVNGRRVPR